MARDFEVEGVWKRRMARVLAEDARRVRLAGLSRPKPVLTNRSLTYPLGRELLTEAAGRICAPGKGLSSRGGGSNGFEAHLARPLQWTLEESIGDIDADEDAPKEDKPHRKSADWSPAEDSLLAHLARALPGNSFKAVADILNFTLHGTRRVRRDVDVRLRLQKIASMDTGVRHRVRHHLERLNLMNASATRLITPRPSVLPKKLNMVAHPSHEAAARKANQNISKLLTPQELALRRIQRTRIMTDPSGAIMVVLPSARTCHSPLCRVEYSIVGKSVGRQTPHAARFPRNHAPSPRRQCRRIPGRHRCRLHHRDRRCASSASHCHSLAPSQRVLGNCSAWSRICPSSSSRSLFVSSFSSPSGEAARPVQCESRFGECVRPWHPSFPPACPSACPSAFTTTSSTAFAPTTASASKTADHPQSSPANGPSSLPLHHADKADGLPAVEAASRRGKGQRRASGHCRLVVGPQKSLAAPSPDRSGGHKACGKDSSDIYSTIISNVLFCFPISH